MKIYHYTLIFCVIAVTVIGTSTMKLALMNDNEQLGITLDEAVDRACDSAAARLRENGDILTKAMAVRAERSFFASLCGYFDTDMTSGQAAQINFGFPLMAITCSDGCYIGYLADSMGENVRIWTDKISYSDTDPEEILRNYCNLRITGSDNGSIFSFILPAEDMGMFERNTHDIGFAVFYRDLISDRVTFASSITRQSEKYYINVEGEGYGSRMYCHVRGCEYLNEEAEEYDTLRECAEKGAFVCPHCRNTVN